MKISVVLISVIMIKKREESGLLDPEDRGTMLLQNVGNCVLINTV
jgi:hypothetical protein